MSRQNNTTETRPRAANRRRRAAVLLAILAAVILAGVSLWAWGTGQTPPNPAPEGQQQAQPATDEQDAQSIPPVTSFDGAKSGDWPEGESTGCAYTTDRLTGIQQGVTATGAEAMRQWYDALDDLQGDAALAKYSADFDTVKRVWSTALAASESEAENADALVRDGQQSLEELVATINCK